MRHLLAAAALPLGGGGAPGAVRAVAAGQAIIAEGGLLPLLAGPWRRWRGRVWWAAAFQEAVHGT